jgi:uncharacterized protein (DUF3084 family)
MNVTKHLQETTDQEFVDIKLELQKYKHELDQARQELEVTKQALFDAQQAETRAVEELQNLKRKFDDTLNDVQTSFLNLKRACL